jgi:triosephosphate isomerase
MNSRIPLIAGNWKLNILPSQANALIQELIPLVQGAKAEVLVCPPFVTIPAAGWALKGTNIKLGAQNLYWQESGAFTGEISGPFLKDAGCSYVVIGHSERRQYFGETDATVNQRTVAALKAGLVPIVCVGETLAEREGNQTFNVIEKQVRDGLKNITDPRLVVAYEPVWAIGTGKTATDAQANEVHVFIRKLLKELLGEAVAGGVRILYGGSVKPDNIKGLMAQSDIDGALVGGASLKAKDFAGIVNH